MSALFSILTAHLSIMSYAMANGEEALPELGYTKTANSILMIQTAN